MKRVFAILLTAIFVFSSAFTVCADSASVSDYSVYKENGYLVPQNDIEII